MGCWNEICAITNLPIMENEEVVMLVLPFEQPHPYFLLNYDSFFSMLYPEYINSITINKGKYDDYGWIKNLNKNNDEYLNSIFIKMNVWNWILDFVKKEERTKKIITDFEEKIEKYRKINITLGHIKESFLFDDLKKELAYILLFCDSIGKHLSIGIKGAQFYEMKYFYEMVQIINDSSIDLEKITKKGIES